jgi:hypothetical protein
MDSKPKSSTLRPKQNPEVLPASQYLQDRLQERRARNPRTKRTRQSDFGPRMPAGHDDDLFLEEAEDSRNAFATSYDSSPLAPMSRYGSDNVSNDNSGATLSAGGRKRRTPGVRELNEQMDRLMKENFDLKLELDHRRDNQAKLHAEIESMRAAVERAQRLEDEHEELMRINSLLVEELEKRDKAIREAADMICELEEKVEDYEESRATETRPSTAHADSGYAGTETQEQMPLSSPPEVVINSRPSPPNPAAATSASNRLNSAVQQQTPAKPRREPSFLTSQKPSTDALRTVYLDAGKDLHPVKSFNSILSKRASTIDEDSMTDDILASPRLSALSESSFPSIYGKKGDTPEKYDWEDLPESTMSYGSAHSRVDSISRVNQWIQAREETPSKSNHVSPMVSTASMGPVRRSAEPSIQSLSSAAASARSDLLDTPTLVKPFPVLGGDRAKNAPKTPLAAGFGGPMLPTPESASTRMLRSSQSSVVGERSLPDVTPAQVKSFASHQPRPSVASNRTQLNSAPASNANLRTDEQSNVRAALKRAAIDDTASESDDDEYHAQSDDLDFDYPDGNSITNGTPSRFLKHNKQSSVAADVFLDTGLSPPSKFTTAVRSPQRRKSSAEVAFSTPSKPALYRSGTSPNVHGIATCSSHGRPATSDSSNASPRSYYSASSSIRPTPRNRHARSLSPEPDFESPQPITAANLTTPSPPKSRPQPSRTPTRSSFSQKTQSLFRRLSNTNTATATSNNETARREREKSPLPTLTSTPSAAYHPQREREVRRPSTSRQPSVRANSRDSRPTLSPRTMTEPMVSPSDTSESLGSSKRSLFRRGGSFKQAADVSSVKSTRR